MLRESANRFLAIALEAVLLAMVVLSPWAYGAVHAGFEFLLDAGVGLLALLWALRILLDGKVAWKKCPVVLGLASLFVLGLWQITPLNTMVLQRLSPTTAHWYERLLPSQPEELPASDQDQAAPVRPGSTISLYPAASRTALQRLLAVLIVFGVVRNQIASPGSFRRLAVAVLVNGALLALFGLAQFFSSPRNLLYWTYPSMGMQVFGPFVYRNHFACYINLCIGLGLGLLWTRQSAAQNDNPPLSWSDWLASPLRLLHDPAALAICVALALMVSSVVFTLSRGGFLALVGGFAVCFLIRLRESVQFVRVGTVLTSLVLAGGLLGWLGLAQIEKRYATLFGGNALHESRLPLWESAFGIVADFPIWGTGFGTCQQVDPLYRKSADLADLSIDHLHNDHLELLVEGGIVGSLLSFVVIGIVCFLGYRAVRRGEATSGLALGAFFSFMTLVFHGLGDFCIHVPAITLLAAVICSHLCAAGRPDRDSVGRNHYSLRWRGLAPILAAIVLIALGSIVVGAGWTMHQTESLHQEAYRVDEKSTEFLEKKRDYLQAAVRLNAYDAELRTELGDVYAELFRTQRDKLALQQHGDSEAQKLRRRYLVPALENYAQARDRGPLLPGPHLGLALFAEEMTRADAASVYRGRVQLLAPSDPTFWYYSGNQELRNGQPKNAWRSWRRSLELSDRYLNSILSRSTKFLEPDELAREVLPDRPAVLLAAANKLYPRADDSDQRKPILQKALASFGDATSLTQNEQRTKAMIYRSLGQPGDAEKIYVTLLEREPLNVGWRYELAEVLYEQGKLDAASNELEMVLNQQREHAAASVLLTKVRKDRVKGR